MDGNASRRFSSRNMVFAAVFVVAALATGIHAYKTMVIGTAAAMGPGFFPLVLSLVLGSLAIGVALAPAAEHAESLRFAPLKAIVVIIGAPVLFGLTVRSLGLVIAVAATIFICSLASRFATVRSAALLAVGFTLFCVLVFSFLLKLPIPLWGDLLVD